MLFSRAYVDFSKKKIGALSAAGKVFVGTAEKKSLWRHWGKRFFGIVNNKSKTILAANNSLRSSGIAARRPPVINCYQALNFHLFFH